MKTEKSYATAHQFVFKVAFEVTLCIRICIPQAFGKWGGTGGWICWGGNDMVLVFITIN